MKKSTECNFILNGGILREDYIDDCLCGREEFLKYAKEFTLQEIDDLRHGKHVYKYGNDFRIGSWDAI